LKGAMDDRRDHSCPGLRTCKLGLR
jgi:hypothetical protein